MVLGRPWGGLVSWTDSGFTAGLAVSLQWGGFSGAGRSGPCTEEGTAVACCLSLAMGQARGLWDLSSHVDDMLIPPPFRWRTWAPMPNWANQQGLLKGLLEQHCSKQEASRAAMMGVQREGAATVHAHALRAAPQVGTSRGCRLMRLGSVTGWQNRSMPLPNAAEEFD